MSSIPSIQLVRLSSLKHTSRMFGLMHYSYWDFVLAVHTASNLIPVTLAITGLAEICSQPRVGTAGLEPATTPAFPLSYGIYLIPVGFEPTTGAAFPLSYVPKSSAVMFYKGRLNSSPLCYFVCLDFNKPV